MDPLSTAGGPPPPPPGSQNTATGRIFVVLLQLSQRTARTVASELALAAQCFPPLTDTVVAKDGGSKVTQGVLAPTNHSLLFFLHVRGSRGAPFHRGGGASFLIRNCARRPRRSLIDLFCFGPGAGAALSAPTAGEWRV